MRLVYIAGPFRARTAWDIEENVRHAERIGVEVARAGAMPVIPHANTRYFSGINDDQFWLDGTLEMLKRCDAIVLSPHWQRSAGSRGEREHALTWPMPVFYAEEIVRLGKILLPVRFYDWLGSPQKSSDNVVRGAQP